MKPLGWFPRDNDLDLIVRMAIEREPKLANGSGKGNSCPHLALNASPWGGLRVRKGSHKYIPYLCVPGSLMSYEGVRHA
jgi:hypothetical protein